MKLLQELRALEEELHQISTRRDSERLEELLHPVFAEVGRSGRVYSRAEIILELVSSDEPIEIIGSEYALSLLAEGIVLLTYKSAHVDTDGSLYRHSRRSSLWVDTATGWQIRFHQGTPTDT